MQRNENESPIRLVLALLAHELPKCTKCVAGCFELKSIVRFHLVSDSFKILFLSFVFVLCTVRWIESKIHDHKHFDLSKLHPPTKAGPLLAPARCRPSQDLNVNFEF